MSEHKLQICDYNNSNKLLTSFTFYDILPPIYRDGDYVHFGEKLCRVKQFCAYFQENYLIHKLFVEVVET